jgi:hypothetical protein
MKSEELRIAKTESLFRDVNERIAETADQFGVEDPALVCECADPECGKRIEATLEDYERTRADGAQFLVAPGHEEPEYEEVVDTRPGFRVVAKLRSLGAVTRRLNPRSETT